MRDIKSQVLEELRQQLFEALFHKLFLEGASFTDLEMARSIVNERECYVGTITFGFWADDPIDMIDLTNMRRNTSGKP